jgi:hypothetical protein
MAAFSAAAAAAYDAPPGGAAAGPAGAAAGGAGGRGSGRPAAGAGLVGAADFVSAMSRVGPSIVRGQAADAGPVGWDDIGGHAGLKRRLRQAVEWPLRHADAFARLGLAPPRGVLLHGPPG